MMESRLQNLFGALESRLRRTRLLRRLTICWAVAAAVGLLLLVAHWIADWGLVRLWPLLALATAIAAAITCIIELRRPITPIAVSAELGRNHPEIRHLLAAATEQQPDSETGSFRFLQLRVIDQVLTHPERYLWRRHFHHQGAKAGYVNSLTLLVCIAVFGTAAVTNRRLPATTPWIASDIRVVPGDAEIERGTALAITARFAWRPPPEATLVLTTASGNTQRIPLQRQLADPVFGASISEISEDMVYHVEYRAKRTRDFKVAVFEYPALMRADAALRFPEYTGLTNKTIPDTLRVSAVEGSHLTYTLQLNKSVAKARLVGKERTIALSPGSNAVVMLEDLVLTNTTRYALQLVDANGRSNKLSSEFVIQVLPNRPADVKLSFPRGDQRVTRLQEVQLQAEATDDFGVLSYGIGFGIAGQPPRFVELGRAVPGGKKQSFNYLIPVEELGVEADQVISYFAWADDTGPDGQARRTFGDMFFAEIRPFEEVFRRDQSGEEEGGGGQRGQGGNQGQRLAELQKQIVIATWKLQRQTENTASGGNAP